MKRIVIALALLAAPALATDYTVTTTANQDAILERARVRSNAAICVAVGLPTSCSRAQAVAADPVRGADYANNLAAFITKRTKDIIQAEKATSDLDDLTAFDQAWAAASQANKDKVCVDLGLAAGCKP